MGRAVSGIQDPHEPEPIGFWVTRSDDAAGVVIALHGELDVAAAPQLEKLLEEIRGEQHRHVMVELSDLSFVDSAGVSVLIKAKKEADEDGSQFLLRRPTAQVHRVFALVGMVDWLVFDER
jgi:anti-anti-sigma factor